MIRPAQASDGPWVRALWNDVIQDTDITFTSTPNSLSDITDLIAARGPQFLVAPELGFATFGPFRSGPGYAHVAEHTIYVAPEAKGQGVGRGLLFSLEAAAREVGIDTLVAGISGSNGPGIRFHERMGFDHVGRLPRVGVKAGERLDLVLMQKDLTRPRNP